MKYNLTLETPENEIIQLLRSKKISLQDCSYQTEKICLFAVNLSRYNKNTPTSVSGGSFILGKFKLCKKSNKRNVFRSN